MVLSKFCTLTVVSDTSLTYPLAPYLFMVIQSPGRSMSLAVSCTPATRPRMVSLKISMMMAAEAPRPASTVPALLLTMMLTTRMKPTTTAMRLNI